MPMNNVNQCVGSQADFLALHVISYSFNLVFDMGGARGILNTYYISRHERDFNGLAIASMLYMMPLMALASVVVVVWAWHLGTVNWLLIVAMLIVYNITEVLSCYLGVRRGWLIIIARDKLSDILTVMLIIVRFTVGTLPTIYNIVISQTVTTSLTCIVVLYAFSRYWKHGTLVKECRL